MVRSTVYELAPQYDSRKSFYNKARVECSGGDLILWSYSTEVAKITADKQAIIYGFYSATTTRHIKEFLLQNGFKAESKSQMERDYFQYVN